MVAGFWTERHSHGLRAWCRVFLFDRPRRMIVNLPTAGERQRYDQPDRKLTTSTRCQDSLLNMCVSRLLPFVTLLRTDNVGLLHQHHPDVTPITRGARSQATLTKAGLEDRRRASIRSESRRSVGTSPKTPRVPGAAVESATADIYSLQRRVFEAITAPFRGGTPSLRFTRNSRRIGSALTKLCERRSNRTDGTEQLAARGTSHRR